MKQYEAPAIEVIELSKTDVITTSGITGGNAGSDVGGGGNILD